MHIHTYTRIIYIYIHIHTVSYLKKNRSKKNRNKPRTSHLCSGAGLVQTIEQSTSALFNVCSRLLQKRRTKLEQSHSAALLHCALCRTKLEQTSEQSTSATDSLVQGLFKKCGACTSNNTRTNERTNDRTNGRTNERTKHLRNGFVSYKVVVQSSPRTSSYKAVVQSSYNARTISNNDFFLDNI